MGRHRRQLLAIGADAPVGYLLSRDEAQRVGLRELHALGPALCTDLVVDRDPMDTMRAMS